MMVDILPYGVLVLGLYDTEHNIHNIPLWLYPSLRRRKNMDNLTSTMGVVSLMRLPYVLNRTGIKKATLWLWIKEGKFPKPVKLGIKSVAWASNEIDAWIQDRISTSRNTEG